MGHYLLQEAPKTGTGDLLISVQAVEPLKIPIIEDECDFDVLVNEVLQNQAKNEDTSNIENQLDRKVYKLYNLSKEEIDYIERI